MYVEDLKFEGVGVKVCGVGMKIDGFLVFSGGCRFICVIGVFGIERSMRYR